jgi:GNAT superfamily N-acetyltransferase
MSVREVRARGRAALDLGTGLLQRARLADPYGGVWEAADLQWWSRTLLPTDEVERPFWLDDGGPVAGVLLTEAKGPWQVDPVVVPGAVVSGAPGLDVVLARGLAVADGHGVQVEVPVADDDTALRDVVRAAGLAPGDRDSTGWLDAADLPTPLAVPDGFRLVDRTERLGRSHPMRARSGDAVEQRLRAASLYDAALDVAIETVEAVGPADGRTAAYSLYWFDPVTRVGLVEPVRVEDEFQRRGLARTMLTAGIDRLAARGATRVKVSWSSEAAGALYRGVGFRPTSTTTWWSRGPTRRDP